MLTLRDFTERELDLISYSLYQQVMNCEAELEAGSKYDYDLTGVLDRQHELELLTAKVQEAWLDLYR